MPLGGSRPETISRNSGCCEKWAGLSDTEETYEREKCICIKKARLESLEGYVTSFDMQQLAFCKS